MKEIPKHYQLVKEHPDTYEIHDSRDKKNFHVAKKALNLAMHAKLSKVKKYSEGTPDEPVQSDRDPASTDAPTDQAPVTVNVNSSPGPSLGVPTAMPQPAPMPVAVPTPMATVPGANIPQAQPVSVPPINPRGPIVPQAAAAENMLEKAEMQKAQIAGQEAAENMPAIQERNEAVKNLYAAAAEKKAQLENEHKQLFDAVANQKIDPDRYWNDKSSLSKVSTGIGILLGGLGAGLQHSTVNQALNMFQERIKNDIESQKEELGKKRTLLSDNLERYKNLDAATAATAAQMNAGLEGKMQLTAAKMGSAKAIANAQAAIAANRQSYFGKFGELAMQDLRVAASNRLNGGAGTQNIPPNGRSPESGAGGPPSSSSAVQPDSGISPDQVDVQKLRDLQTADVLKGPEAESAFKEIGEIQKNAKAKDIINKEFDNIKTAVKQNPQGVENAVAQNNFANFPWGIGNAVAGLPSWGHEAGRNYRASIASLKNNVNQVLTKRLGGEAMKNIALTLPDGRESPKQFEEMRQRTLDLLDKSLETPVLSSYGILKKR